MAMPKVGDKAPGFNLVNEDGEMVALEDFKEQKNVVIFFYPRALTPGCTLQANSIRKYKRYYTERDTVVLGISPDPVARLEKFRDKYSLNFSLLSDEDAEVLKQYGVWGPKKFLGKEYEGVLRTSFIVGKDGRIKHVMEKVNTKTHHKEVLNFIKQNL